VFQKHLYVVFITLQADDDESAVYVGDIRVMLQYVPEPIKKGKKRARGTIHVWIQQGRQLRRVHGGSTFVQW